MKKVTQKASAKINLTLDILGVSGGYHLIKSLVCSTKLCDKITVKKRKDDKITIKMKGLPIDCATTDNNAFKAAVLFKKCFNTCGVDIVIEKNIPVGGGLGGSSADIAGVLNAMQKLFSIDKDLSGIANELSSDAYYMLKGGFAVMSGRGDSAKWLDFDKKLYFVIFTDKESVSTRACYKAFDDLGKTYDKRTEQAVNALIGGKDEEFLSALKNDLYEPCKTLNENVELNLIALKSVGAQGAVMTGSGSSVVGVFTEKEKRDEVYKILLSRFGNKIIKTETI